jgi:3-oxoacyl-[acyl-carrier protein] reductase
MYLDDFKDKVVLITGASTGIGAACAKAFGALGAKVGVHYNSSGSAAAEVAAAVEKAGGQALMLQGDLRNTADCERIVAETAKRFNRIDVLINNAGALVKRIPITELTDEIYDEVVGLNVRSLLMCTKYAVPHMTGGGNIINLTSVAARTGGGPGASLYAGSKGFVSTATRSLAKELIGKKIRVNAVAPGVITTPFHDKFSTAEQLDQLSGYVTGQVIEVNGGQYMP